MTPENAPAVEPESQTMGDFSRLAGTIFEPGKTFEDIARRPTWLVPLALVMAISCLYIGLFTQHVGWERFMRQQIESSSRTQQLSAEQKEQAIALQVKLGPVFGYGGVIIGTPLVYLICAGVLLGIVAGIMSAPVKFKQVFSVMCFSAVPSIIGAVLAMVVMFLKNPNDFDLQNPTMFNLGAFLDPDKSSKFLYSVAGSFDLFVIWTILLIAIGLRAAAGKKQLSFGGALFSVVLPWGVYVLGRAALKSIF
jgi:hypothetical protein